MLRGNIQNHAQFSCRPVVKNGSWEQFCVVKIENGAT